MKRYLLMAFFMYCLFGTLSASAQDGLGVKALFEKKYQAKDNVTVVFVKGQEIKRYGLTMFRSIVMAEGSALSHHVEAIVKQDALKATSKEVAVKNGRLYYGFYSFRPVRSKINRYLLYRNNALGETGKSNITLIYMEGKTSLEQLRKNFKMIGK